MIEQALHQAGSDWRFLTFEVGSEDLGDAIRGVRALGLRGAKIIEPHREAVLEFVDHQTRHARLARWANSITLANRQLTADNTVGKALVRLVDTIAGKRFCILGAGLAARAIATALALDGAAELLVVSRSAEKGAAITQSVGEISGVATRHINWPDGKLTVAPQFEVLVNATSVGSAETDAPLAIDLDSLRTELTVADVSFTTPTTWLLRAAGERGCPSIDGLSLLVEQTAIALRAWSDIEADRAAMREAAEEFLAI